MEVTEMRGDDVAYVARLISQLHPDQPGTINPERIRQGWKDLRGAG